MSVTWRGCTDVSIGAARCGCHHTIEPSFRVLELIRIGSVDILLSQLSDEAIDRRDPVFCGHTRASARYDIAMRCGVGHPRLIIGAQPCYPVERPNLETSVCCEFAPFL